MSMTPPRWGLSWRTCRRSVRHPRLWPDAAPLCRGAAAGWSSHSSGTMPARSRSSPGGRRRARRTSSAQVPTISMALAAPPAASHACPASPQHPERGGTPARSRPPALSPGAFGRLPQVATWRTRTRAEPMACRRHWPVLAGDHNPCWRAGSADRAAWADSAGINLGIDGGRIRGAGMQPGLRSQCSPIFAGRQRRADGCWPLPSLMLVQPWDGQGTAQPGPAAAERTCGGGGRPGGGGAAVSGG